MKLRSLDIQRLPGIQPGFKVQAFGPGINVVIGPNASGKSSLVRALKAVLYTAEQATAALHLEAVFEDAHGELTVTRLSGDQTWQRAGQGVMAPRLPEHRFLPCYTLRVEDLLEHGGLTDAAIAERLARELAGGYDIPAVRDAAPFRLKTTHGAAEARQLHEAREALSRKQREHQGLHQQEATLGRLRKAQQQARAASAQAKIQRDALALLESRTRREQLEQQCSDYPQAMTRLQGDELSRLQGLRQSLEDQRAGIAQARREEQAAAERLLASGLQHADVDEAGLDDYRQALRQLQQLESRQEQDERTLKQATADLERARELLGGAPDAAQHLQPGAIHRVEQQLLDKRALEADLLYLKAELELLPDPHGQAADPEQLRLARLELLHWLAAPGKVRWRGRRLAAAVTVCLSAALGIGAAGVWAHPAFALLLLPLAGGVAQLLLRADPGDVEREGAQLRFGRSGVAMDMAWDREHVQSQLGELDRGLLDAERKAAARRQAEEAEARRQLRTRDLAVVDGALAALAREVGFEPQTLDASLQRWMMLLSEHDRASAAVAAARQAWGQDRGRAEGIRAGLLAFLAQHGEAPLTEAPDADALAGRLDHLKNRIRARDGALEQAGQARREVRRLQDAAEALEGQVRDVFDQAGVAQGQEAVLGERLQRLAAWQALMEQLRDARSVERERAQVLGDRPDLMPLLQAGDQDGLQRRLEHLEQQAAGLEALVQDITRIEGALDQAGKARELEQARADLQQAEDILADSLDEALLAEAGRSLLEQVSSEHVRASQPPALRRARDWFRRFTHNQFELEFDTASAQGPGPFAATETSTGARRTLAELSSGTRMQLLLAVRIAFALETEQGCEPLPLILDEALTTADPERFLAAAQSLRTLAEETNRQVFYLSSQPGDIAYWQAQGGQDGQDGQDGPVNQVNCIDLGQLRRAGAAITDPGQIRLPEVAATPLPTGQSAEAYALALGVPPLDPWAGADAIHLFFLLRDALELLHRLVDARIRTVGNLRSLLASSTISVFLSSEDVALLRRRIAAAQDWLGAWRRGRGRPVDRQALEQAEAVSGTYLRRVLEQCELVGGDAAALLLRLEAGEVKGFRKRKTDELREWLLEHNYLDEQPPLSEAQMEHRLHAVVASCHTDAESGLQEARLLHRSLSSAIAVAKGIAGSLPQLPDSPDSPDSPGSSAADPELIKSE